MRKTFTFLLILVFSILVVSCKNDVKPESSNTEISEKSAPKPVKKKDLTPEEMERLTSVMSQLMLNPDSKKFASYCVTAGLTEMLSNEKGPFTIFAPANSAFESLSPEKRAFYTEQSNRASLVEMLKSHIVEGLINKDVLTEAMAKSGKTTLKTMAGTTLTISKSGDNLVVSTKDNGQGQILKSDILGSNGVVYIVDGVLRIH